MEGQTEKSSDERTKKWMEKSSGERMETGMNREI